MKLPVLLWKEGWRFSEPAGYQPHLVEVGEGVLVDEARLPHFLNQLLDEHPEGQRLRKEAAKQLPSMGLAVDRGADGYVYVAVWRDRLWHPFCEAIGQPALADDLPGSCPRRECRPLDDVAETAHGWPAPGADRCGRQRPCRRASSG